MIQDRTKSFMYNVDNMISLDNYLTKVKSDVETKQAGGGGDGDGDDKQSDTSNPTYLKPPILPTISSLFLDEIQTNKKHFLEENSTNYLINKLSHTIDLKLIKELPNIDIFTFKKLDFDKIINNTGESTTDEISTKTLIENINDYLTKSNNIETRMLNEINQSVKHIESAKSSESAVDGGSIVNALLIDHNKNDKFNLFSIEDTNTVQNDALEILEQPNTEKEQLPVGGNINIVNKKTRRKKKDKNPKKITRRRLIKK